MTSVYGMVGYAWYWVLAVPVGTVFHLDTVWLIADTLNAFMALPNLIALLLLGPLVFRITREYFDSAPAQDLSGR